MNKVVKGALIGVAVLVTGATMLSVEASTRIRPGASIGPIPVGDLTQGQARAKLAAWWQSAENKPLVLKSARLPHACTETPAKLGIRFDEVASLQRAPRSTLLDLIRKPKPSKIAPILTLKIGNLGPLADAIVNQANDSTSAKAFYSHGRIVRIPETGEPRVDVQKLRTRILKAVAFRTSLEVPFAQGPKRVSDQQLQGVSEVVTGVYDALFYRQKKPLQ